MFNRSKGSSGSNLATVVPIDEDEQTRIAEELKQQAASQSATTRTMFYYLYLVAALILFICLLYSIFSPWEMDHQKVFQDIVPVYGFVSYYSASIYCCAIGAMIVKVGPYRTAMCDFSCGQYVNL